MKTKHTPTLSGNKKWMNSVPLPWHIAQHGNSGPKWEIRCAGHGNVADMRDNGRNREQGEKVAAFICKAVNSHAALVEALERMLNAYAPYADQTVAQQGDGGLHRAVREARTALKLAKGET